MAAIQMSADGTWNVDCYVCGKRLGFNKELCGKDAQGKKKSSRPPCVWAHTDSAIVAKCVQEQQKRTKTARLAQAEAEKEKQREEASEQARKRLAEGWKPSFEEDNIAIGDQRTEEQKRDQMEPSVQHLNDQTEKLKKEEAAFLQPAVTQPIGAMSTSDKSDVKQADAKANEDIKNTNWTHQSRMMLYGWVAKLNPFKAARGQAEESWNTVAARVVESTKDLTKKEGRIELCGHALRVFLAKQMAEGSKFGNYKRQLKAEGTLSGQAGLLSNHETLEFNMLDQLAGMKKEAQEDNASLKDDKNLLKSIKDDQMNDQIFARAMAKPEFKAEMFKTLNKKRKKLEIKIDALVSASKRPRAEVVASQLDDEERKTLQRHEELKAERRSSNEGTTDGYDSDDNANRTNQKKGRFHETMAAISNMETKMSRPQEETVLEKTLTEWLLQKMDSRRAQQHAPQIQDIATRLKKLDDAKKMKLITNEEHAAQRERILSSSF